MNGQKSSGNGFVGAMIWLACFILIKLALSFITQLFLAQFAGH